MRAFFAGVLVNQDVAFQKLVIFSKLSASNWKNKIHPDWKCLKIGIKKYAVVFVENDFKSLGCSFENETARPMSYF